MYNTVSTHGPTNTSCHNNFYYLGLCLQNIFLYEEDENLEWNFWYEYYYAYLKHCFFIKDSCSVFLI